MSPVGIVSLLDEDGEVLRVEVGLTELVSGGRELLVRPGGRVLWEGTMSEVGEGIGTSMMGHEVGLPPRSRLVLM
jgi:hypothetical protein